MNEALASVAPAPHRRYRRLIEAHFGGRAWPAGETVMRTHLVSCADCRAHYDRHLHLAAVDPQGAIPRRERLARGLGLAAPAREPRRWVLLAGSAVAACAFAFAMFGTRPAVQSRGAQTRPGSQLLVYAVTEGSAAPVVSEVRAGSELAFAYANISHRRRLMVFAVDDDRRVYWFHPAWQNAAEDPVGVAIAADDAVHELPQAVYHPFSGGRLQLFGVFMDGTMSAREMELAIGRSPSDEQGQLRLSLPTADVSRLDLRVVSR
jgi:hypothetical protein